MFSRLLYNTLLQISWNKDIFRLSHSVASLSLSLSLSHTHTHTHTHTHANWEAMLNNTVACRICSSVCSISFSERLTCKCQVELFLKSTLVLITPFTKLSYLLSLSVTSISKSCLSIWSPFPSENHAQPPSFQNSVPLSMDSQVNTIFKQSDVSHPQLPYLAPCRCVWRFTGQITTILYV
jgi:hypothetical protein